jgi:hypothetical protein
MDEKFSKVPEKYCWANLSGSGKSLLWQDN